VTLYGTLSYKEGMGMCSANYGCRWYFFKGNIFDQVVLLAVSYDKNNNQILFSFVVVTSETEDNWMWLRHQLEQDIPGSHVLVADFTMGIESHQFQGDIRSSGCLFSRYLKHLFENTEKATTSIKEGETQQLASSKWEEPEQNSNMNKLYRTSKPSILKQLSG
jgi:hypothetical protein